MAIIPFCKANNPPTIEAVHINSNAILFVESTAENQVGQTLVQIFGQTEQGVRVVESVAHVLEVFPPTATTKQVRRPKVQASSTSTLTTLLP